ncbi:MAG: SDR family oxidoreductase [Chloroflexi bacterium]|nr:SDR family oxidoreductase [Chloroflexota bacterium]MBI4504853.1 SDR family oxidoreductase [Chloroflexota bacterium]
MPLEGRVALVTGAGRNIGRATALALARAGADVVVNVRQSRDEAEAVAAEARSHGVRALAVVADVGVAIEAQALCARALEALGKVDIVVNNAAIRPHVPFVEMTWEQWQSVLDVDLHASFWTIKACLPGMLAQRWGRIINLTGGNAMSGYVGAAHVSVAKHGLLALTKSLAKELGPHGVTVNAVSPGAIDTTGTRHNPERLKRIPAGRPGLPEEIAATCLYLASDEAAFVNGQMIAVNGGEWT